MRSFRDDGGLIWEVAVGQASYGTHILIFSRRDSREIRQAPMDASTALDAQNELADLSESELRARLIRSEDWP